jgi:hypothetical protein
MKNITIVLIIYLILPRLSAQVKTDAVSIFKMQIFLDKKNADFRGMDSTSVKGDSLYRSFCDVVELKLDTLKITGNYDLTKSALAPKYQFYRLLEYSYNRKLNNNEQQFYWIFGRGVSIIAINQKTGISYRLKGFNGNDFLGFLSDLKEEYKEANDEKLTTKQFLNSYKVESMDFQCLYEGLISSELDRNKYPCLKRESDPVWVH